MKFETLNMDMFFSCTQCGECCKGFGGTYVSDEDIDAIAVFLGISPAVVRSEYCDTSGGRFVIAQRADGYCVFWDRNCTIHSVKPRMCRQWPFIPGLLADINNWRIMASMCPGMASDADLDHVLQLIIERGVVGHKKP